MRYQRRNAISPTSNEAIVLRTFSSVNSFRHQVDFNQTNRRLSIGENNQIELRLHLEKVFEKTKKSCAAPAA